MVPVEIVEFVLSYCVVLTSKTPAIWDTSVNGKQEGILGGLLQSMKILGETSQKCLKKKKFYNIGRNNSIILGVCFCDFFRNQYLMGEISSVRQVLDWTRWNC